MRRRQCRFPTVDRGRDTALPSPNYHFGVTGIDMISNPLASKLLLAEIRRRQCRFPTVNLVLPELI
jgi:hypothetical protein